MSVIFQYMFHIKPVLTISRYCFWPIPKVDTMMLCFRPRNLGNMLPFIDVKKLNAMVKLLFKKRRKQIKNIDQKSKEYLNNKFPVSSKLRPENLSILHWCKIINFINLQQ